jgi:predicted house-cleaning NTP pyrophosphatase (Maf/HAM1 superfamily)
MTGQEVFEPDFGQYTHAAELNKQLHDFYDMFTPRSDRLGEIITRAMSTPTNAEDVSLAPGIIYIQGKENPDTSIDEFSKNSILISTSSDRKWNICSGIAALEGFIPKRNTTTNDEEQIHAHVRKNDRYPEWYPLTVAALKQTHDTSGISILTLDTVTSLDGTPMEKANDLSEAEHMIAQASGNRVTCDTGWVFGVPLKSGASILLTNSTKISYTMKHLSPDVIRAYVEHTPSVLNIAGAIDLSTMQARGPYIDTTIPVTFTAYTCFGNDGELTVEGSTVYASVLNPLFAGVPVHAIRAFLHVLPEIYTVGDQQN